MFTFGEEGKRWNREGSLGASIVSVIFYFFRKSEATWHNVNVLSGGKKNERRKSTDWSFKILGCLGQEV